MNAKYMELFSTLSNNNFFIMRWPSTMTANDYHVMISLVELQLKQVRRSMNRQIEKEGYDCGCGI